MTGRVDDRGQLVKAEGNFEDHPYFTVGNQRSGEGVIRYSNTIRTRDGQELKQTWTVRAVQGLGLPGTLDQDVYVALLQLIDRQGEIPTDGWIGFSIYELVELLHRTHGGRDYRQIKESLERLSGTIIQSKNAFYRKSTKSYLDDTFHLLDRVQHSETEDRSGRRGERTWVKLSDYFVDSYKANYLKGLDADFYWSLNSSVAKRLYRFVDKKRSHQSRWEVDLFSLRDRIPLSPYQYPSKIKEKLAPAHDELRHKGFLEEVSYRKTGDGRHLVCYLIRPGFSSRRPELQQEPSPEEKIAVERLKGEGVRADVAESLARDHGPERCLRYAEALPFQKNIRNRAGWLKKAIQEGYELDAPPPSRTTVRADATEISNEVANGNSPDAFRKSRACTSAGDNTAVGEASASRGPREASAHSLVRPGATADNPISVAPEEDAEAREVWDRVMPELHQQGIDPDLSDIWFRELVPTALSGTELVIHAPTEFAADYVTSRFSAALDASASSVLGPGASISIVHQTGQKATSPI